jgi:hypothetical protein
MIRDPNAGINVQTSAATAYPGSASNQIAGPAASNTAPSTPKPPGRDGRPLGHQQHQPEATGQGHYHRVGLGDLDVDRGGVDRDQPQQVRSQRSERAQLPLRAKQQRRERRAETDGRQEQQKQEELRQIPRVGQTVSEGP